MDSLKGKKMKIIDLKLHVLKSPLAEPFAFSQGWVTQRSATLVELITDEGISGWGEAYAQGLEPPEISVGVRTGDTPQSERQRMLRNRNKPALVVIDPRRTETATAATQHLALRPKSDLTLLYGLANLLVQNDWIDRAFIERSTSGFAEFAAFVRQFTPDKVAAETGITVAPASCVAESSAVTSASERKRRSVISSENTPINPRIAPAKMASAVLSNTLGPEGLTGGVATFSTDTLV